MSEQVVAVWRGELLWPQKLPDGPVIDCAAVSVLGVWVHDWLRQRPNRCLVGDERLRAQLQRAGVPVRWFADVATALAAYRTSRGVSASERDMLWN